MHDDRKSIQLMDSEPVEADESYDEPMLDTAVPTISSPEACPILPDPVCDHSEIGYDCECVRKPAIDPFTHKPVWSSTDYPDYSFFHRDVYNFN